MRAARAGRSRPISAFTTARPAAVASGLPPKVEPWSPGEIDAANLSLARQAEIGTPPPSDLAIVRMSGSTPECS